MAKVIVLGGAGAVGSITVRTLALHQEFSEVVIGDFNKKKSEELRSQIGSSKVSYTHFDAHDTESIHRAIAGCDVVLNCVGPFYSTVKPILAAAIEDRIHYVDVCDDVDVTLEILQMDGKAKKAGVTALIGMGNSPGVTNIIAKLAATDLLDETDSIDIFHAHGGEKVEGEGVIGHRFHCMSIDIPMFLDGEMKHVKYFERDGIALRETFEFPVLGKVPLYPYPHPEQVTIPNYIKTRRVTNKGSVIPNEYYELTRDLCGLGFSSREPLEVNGQQVTPYDFAVAYILRERERILKKLNFGAQRGCCTVVVKGKKGGEYKELRFHMASKSQALGEGTGIPAAMGAILMHRGKVEGKGVMPPEACMDPHDLLALMPEVMDLDRKTEGGESFGGFIIESVDRNGNVSKMNM
ncbi:MAG TPA: saccharopine dehydrogenase NADP-binding domain-containing protein [Spirochaetota bacterium]|nr:saccharopine dehydrogenase NADP-binding domain-containing protein [Spirochaetota bacterium]